VVQFLGPSSRKTRRKQPRYREIQRNTKRSNDAMRDMTWEGKMNGRSESRIVGDEATAL